MLNAWQEYRSARKDLNKRADVVHNLRDVGASIASGSFITEGMVIAPCSMKTLAAVAHAHSDNLITRAADVCSRSAGAWCSVPRETPLNLAHLRNMTAVTEMGGIIFPPVPAFYAAPELDDLVAHSVGRVLDSSAPRPPHVLSDCPKTRAQWPTAFSSSTARSPCPRL